MAPAKQAAPPMAVAAERRGPAVARVVDAAPLEATPKAEILAGRPPLPPVLEPVSLGQVAWRTDPDEWKNVGRRSIGAAVQSLYWAISRGEIDYLQDAISLDPASENAMAALFEQASPKLREQYPTPDSFVAFLLASQPAIAGVAIGRIVEEKSTPDNITVSIATTAGEGKFDGGGHQRFRRTPSGDWVRTIGPAEINTWRQMLKWDRELSKSRSWKIGASN